MSLGLARTNVVTGSRKFTNIGHDTQEPDEVTAMRDNPVHTFFQVLGDNISDQLSLGGLRWLEVTLYWVLLIGSLAIAYTNWRLDSTKRTGTHLNIYAMRLVSAGMWYLGTLWKQPLPIAAGSSIGWRTR
jgi:hypothetical protein